MDLFLNLIFLSHSMILYMLRCNYFFVLRSEVIRLDSTALYEEYVSQIVSICPGGQVIADPKLWFENVYSEQGYNQATYVHLSPEDYDGI